MKRVLEGSQLARLWPQTYVGWLKYLLIGLAVLALGLLFTDRASSGLFLMLWIVFIGVGCVSYYLDWKAKQADDGS
jgi:hypothetical protein